MKIVISGATGFIGSALVPFLEKSGHLVNKIVRTKEKKDDSVFWDPVNREIDAQALEGTDVVIHLAGENIGTTRWSSEKKKRIFESRVHGTRFLVDILSQCKKPPKTLLCSSAVGIYGYANGEVKTEASHLGTGFLADVCREWEKEAEKSKEVGTRVVLLRTGLVLDPRGGVLKAALPLFRWGLGGVIGSGEQYMSWIALEDFLRIVAFALQTPSLEGPINCAAPHPVTNRTWTKTLGSILHRPTLVPLPATVATLVFGEMAQETLLSSCRASPERLLQAGFTFRYPELKQALVTCLS